MLVQLEKNSIMIVAKYRKSNKYAAWIFMAMGLVIIIGLIPSVEIDSSKKLVIGFVLLIFLLILFFVLPIAILNTKKELSIDKDILTIKSNMSSDKVLDLRQMLKWRYDDTYQRYQVHHGIICILKPDKKVLTIWASEYDKFDDILKYFKLRYSRKQVKQWTDKV